MVNNVAKAVFSEINTAGKLWNIPNIMCGLIVNNKIEEIESWSNSTIAIQKLSNNSIFRIGSNSKSFACAALIQLINQYGINLNDPVIAYYPEFQLCEDELTKKICIKDLVTHNTGLGKFTCSMMGFLNYGSSDIINGMKYIPILKSFRTSFQYNNGMYLIAEKVLNNITRNTIEHFYSTNFFNKLDMVNTSISLPASRLDIATPYVEYNGVNIPITQSEFSDSLGMGTNINTNIIDISKWVLFNLELFNSNSANFTHFKQQFLKYVYFQNNEITTCLDNYVNWEGYALGWYSNKFNKFQLYEHLGGVPGYTSYISLIPELKSGIVLLCNKSNMRYPLELIRLVFFDLLVNGRQTINMTYELFKQTTNFQKSLNHKISCCQEVKLPVAYHLVTLTLFNHIYKTIIFTINSSQITLQFKSTNITFNCVYRGGDIFVLIDHLHHFSTLLKLITLKINLVAKTLEMKIFMDNGRGGLSWISDHLFNEI